MGKGQEPWASLTPNVPEEEPTHNFTFNRDLVSTDQPQDGSEFGGVSNIIQPSPHLPTASERLQTIHHIDPADDGTTPTSITAPELDGNF